MGTTDRLLAEGRFLRFVDRDGWEFIERSSSWAVVLLVPVTDDDELVFVEQYRPPVGRRVIELPAGLVGDHPGAESESLATAARRELLEETGYEADSLVELFAGVPSAGITSEEITFFLARDLRRVGPGGGDDTEDIVVHHVPLHEADEWLHARAAEGLGLDAKVFSGIYFARQSANTNSGA